MSVTIEEITLFHVAMPLVRAFETSSHKKSFIEHILVRCDAGVAHLLRIYEPSGRLIEELPFSQQVDISKLATGTYVVFAIDAKGRPLARVRLVKL